MPELNDNNLAEKKQIAKSYLFPCHPDSTHETSYLCGSIPPTVTTNWVPSIEQVFKFSYKRLDE